VCSYKDPGSVLETDYAFGIEIAQNVLLRLASQEKNSEHLGMTVSSIERLQG